MSDVVRQIVVPVGHVRHEDGRVSIEGTLVEHDAPGVFTWNGVAIGAPVFLVAPSNTMVPSWWGTATKLELTIRPYVDGAGGRKLPFVPVDKGA